MYAGLAFFTHAMFGVLGAAVEGSMFSWVSIFANLNQVGDVLFRMPPRYDTPSARLRGRHRRSSSARRRSCCSRRIRAVEVVT